MNTKPHLSVAESHLNSVVARFCRGTMMVFRPLQAVGILIGGLLSFALPASGGPQGATPWVVIKCKFSDQPQEPAFNSSFITSTADGMAAYWANVSNGQINLDGSVVKGWYTLPITLAEAQAFPSGTRRAQIVDTCIAAATDVTVTDFYSVIVILNAGIDSGASGKRVLLDPSAWNISFAAHEMGHGYGLGHSYDDSGTIYCCGDPGVYADGWDIMSALAFFGSPNPMFTGVYGLSGPGMNAPNMDKLGWLAGNRIVTWDGTTSPTVTLAALNRPLASGYLMAKVPIPGDPSRYLTVEFRRPTDWDRGIAQQAVLIHEVRPNAPYLIKANGGPERLPGQTFRDVNANIAITVLNFDSVAETATINIGRNEVWVDFAYPRFPFDPEHGTFSAPYNTVAEGVSHVAHSGTIKFKTGSSSETPTIGKPMTLQAVGGPVTIGQ